MKNRNEIARRLANAISFVAATLLIAPGLPAQDAIPTKEDVAKAHGKVQFSPHAGRHFPTKVLWGDQHLHTEISVDAGTLCRLAAC